MIKTFTFRGKKYKWNSRTLVKNILVAIAFIVVCNIPNLCFFFL